MRSTTVPVLVAGALAGATLATGVAVATSPSGARPSRAVAAAPDPSHFEDPRQNPWFPLRPGTVLRYRGSEDGERFRQVTRVTHRTRLVQGVRTTVVRDVIRRADGTLAESTWDWYAADEDGTVWYFGERTATYDERGRLESREGSWEAGRGGARAGIVMPADPRPTDAYRQEYDPGDAEDQAWVVERGIRARVPYGRLRRVVRSLEWTRLERGVVAVKLYAPGLGIVRERDLSGGDELVELVSVRRPR